MALDPRNIARPTSARPDSARTRVLDAFKRVLTEPLANNVMFSTLLKNSLVVAVGVSVSVTVLGGFGSLRLLALPFSGSQVGPVRFHRGADAAAGGDAGAALCAAQPDQALRRRESAHDAAWASGSRMSAARSRSRSGTCAATSTRFHGSSRNRRWSMAPVRTGPSSMSCCRWSLPAIAITVLFGFMAAWTEFVLAWTFLTDPSRFTLAMGLSSMVGQYSSRTRRGRISPRWRF